MEDQHVQPTVTFLRSADMMRKLGIRSRTTLYRFEEAGIIPARRRVSAGCVGWLSDEVDAWLRSRPAAS